MYGVWRVTSGQTAGKKPAHSPVEGRKRAGFLYESGCAPADLPVG